MSRFSVLIAMLFVAQVTLAQDSDRVLLLSSVSEAGVQVSVTNTKGETHNLTLAGPDVNIPIPKASRLKISPVSDGSEGFYYNPEDESLSFEGGYLIQIDGENGQKTVLDVESAQYRIVKPRSGLDID
jgi:hypothetical protein